MDDGKDSNLVVRVSEVLDGANNVDLRRKEGYSVS